MIATFLSAPAEFKDNSDVNNGGRLLPDHYGSWSATIAGFQADLKANCGHDQYILSKRYGALYLDAEEREACVRDTRAAFYTGLARRWWRGRLGPTDLAFWDYQRRGLATIDERGGD